MPTELQALALRAVTEAARCRSNPSHVRMLAVKLLREQDNAARSMTEYVAAVTRALAEYETARLTGYPKLLAAYRAEATGSTDALIYAQNIAERLIADDMFGRLANIRARLERLHTVPPAEVWKVIEQAVAELGEIVGGVSTRDEEPEEMAAEPQPVLYRVFMYHDQLTPNTVREVLDLPELPTVGDVFDLRGVGFRGVDARWRVTRVDKHSGGTSATAFMTDADSEG